MKQMIGIYILVWLLAGCTESCPPENSFEYKILNKSGHLLTVRFNDIYDFPPMVILNQGDVYQWHNGLDGFTPFWLRENSYIMYDDNVKLSIENFLPERHILERDSYMVEQHKNHYIYTYTFTVEDYKYAVGHNEYEQGTE